MVVREWPADRARQPAGAGVVWEEAHRLAAASPHRHTGVCAHLAHRPGEVGAQQGIAELGGLGLQRRPGLKVPVGEGRRVEHLSQKGPGRGTDGRHHPRLSGND